MSKGPDGPAATSFSNPRRTGYLVKHGGTGMAANWRKRWFVLDHGYIFYYKGDKDRKPVGVVALSEYKRCYRSSYKKGSKSKFILIVEKDDSMDEPDSQARNYEMFPHSETEEDTQGWIDAINAEIKASYSLRGANRVSKIDDKSFSQLVTSTEDQPKLVHLTANRPKMKGRRPPQKYKTFHEDEDSSSGGSPSTDRKTSLSPTASPQSSPQPSPKTRGQRPSVAIKPPKQHTKGSDVPQELPSVSSDETFTEEQVKTLPEDSPTTSTTDMSTPSIKVPPTPPTKPRPPLTDVDVNNSGSDNTEVMPPSPTVKPRPPPPSAKPRRTSSEAEMHQFAKEVPVVAKEVPPVIKEVVNEPHPVTKVEESPSAKPRSLPKAKSISDTSQASLPPTNIERLDTTPTQDRKFKKPLPPGKAKKQLPSQHSLDDHVTDHVTVVEQKPAEDVPQPKSRPVPKPRTKTMASPIHRPATTKPASAKEEPLPNNEGMTEEPRYVNVGSTSPKHIITPPSNVKEEPRYVNVGSVSPPTTVEPDESDTEEPPPPPLSQVPPSSKPPLPTPIETSPAEEPPLPPLQGPPPSKKPLEEPLEEPPPPPQSGPPPSKEAPPLPPVELPSSLPAPLEGPPSLEEPLPEKSPLSERPPLEGLPPSEVPPLDVSPLSSEPSLEGLLFSEEPPPPPLSGPPPSKEAPPLPPMGVSPPSEEPPPPPAVGSPPSKVLITEEPSEDLPPPPPAGGPPPSKSPPPPPSVTDQTLEPMYDSVSESKPPMNGPHSLSINDDDDIAIEESLYDRIQLNKSPGNIYNIPKQSNISSPDSDHESGYSVPRTPVLSLEGSQTYNYDVPKKLDVTNDDRVPTSMSDTSLNISPINNDVDLPESFGFRESRAFISPTDPPPSDSSSSRELTTQTSEDSEQSNRSSQHGPPPERDGWGYAIVNKTKGGTYRPVESPQDWLAQHVQKPEDYTSVPEALQKAREILRLAKIVKMEADEMRKDVERELALVRRDRLDAELLKKNATEILKMAKDKLKASS